MPNDDGIWRCSFCGQSQCEVRLVAGPARRSIFICDECVELCSKVLQERPDDSVIIPGFPPGFLALLNSLGSSRGSRDELPSTGADHATDMTDYREGVVRVGDGRGFIIEADDRRLIVTAAHCLPRLPICDPGTSSHERSYVGLLGPLDEAPRSVCAECVFADPVADIAVLGRPDNQTFWKEADDYDALTTARPAFSLGAVPDDFTGPALLLSLDREWTRCIAECYGGPLWLKDAEAGIRGGMSGSPIVDSDYRAIGVIVVGSSTTGVDIDDCKEGGPNPRLSETLPGWIVREVLNGCRPDERNSA